MAPEDVIKTLSFFHDLAWIWVVWFGFLHPSLAKLNIYGLLPLVYVIQATRARGPRAARAAVPSRPPLRGHGGDDGGRRLPGGGGGGASARDTGALCPRGGARRPAGPTACATGPGPCPPAGRQGRVGHGPPARPHRAGVRGSPGRGQRHPREFGQEPPLDAARGPHAPRTFYFFEDHSFLNPLNAQGMIFLGMVFNIVALHLHGYSFRR